MAEPPQSPTIHGLTEGLPCLWVAFSAFLPLLHKDTHHLRLAAFKELRRTGIE